MLNGRANNPQGKGALGIRLGHACILCCSVSVLDLQFQSILRLQLSLNPNSEFEQSDLTQSPDRKGVLSILACINRYALGSPQLLSTSTLRQLITFNFGVRVNCKSGNGSPESPSTFALEKSANQILIKFHGQASFIFIVEDAQQIDSRKGGVQGVQAEFAFPFWRKRVR